MLNLKTISHRNLINFILITLLMCVSCTPKQDYSDPELVAKAFWTAIANQDAQTAAENIYPPARAQLAKMIQKDILMNTVPVLPETLEFEIRIDGNEAVAVILNSGNVGCDLINADGRWWIR